MRITDLLFFSILIIALSLGGCASSPKYKFMKDDPWYQEVNPMNPKSDWEALDLTPNSLAGEKPPYYQDMRQDMMDIIDYY